MLVHCLLLSITVSCCCCSAEGPPGPPRIHLNSVLLPNQTETVLTAGSRFSLSCHGNGYIHWSSTAFRFLYQDKLPDPIEVKNSVPRHTGTYRCGYIADSLGHLSTWIHLYINDTSDNSSVFVTPRSVSLVKEGQDFLLKCMLTDPSLKNLTLHLEGRTWDSGPALPPGMNVTIDPKRGALIHHLRRSYGGRYVCSGWKDGRHFTSRPVGLQVVPRLRCPPSLSVSQDEVVLLNGETFEVICITSNPSHFVSVTWTHPIIQTLNVTVSRHYNNHRLYVNSTLTVSAVSVNHSGPYTCTAVNEAGGSMATVQLRVLDQPYLIIYLQLMEEANANSRTPENKDLFTNVSSMSVVDNWTMIVNTDTNETHGSTGSRVGVYEGRDVRLTFLIEAYPLIRNKTWTIPAHITNKNNAVYQESYTTTGYRSEARLLLRRVRQEDQGRYSLHYSNAFFNGSQNVDLRIYHSPSAAVTLRNKTLTCSSSGYPSPTVLWYSCPGVQHTCADVSTYQVSPSDVTSEEEGEEVRKHLHLPAGDDVTVECVAFNEMGESRQVFSPRNQPPTFFSPALIGALSAVAVVLLMLSVVVYKWRQNPKYEVRWKIIESTEGNHYTFIDPTQLPYNLKWEFPRDQLRLGAVLGSGAFGKVVEATAYGLGTNNVTRVAVKMLKPSADSEEREALMSELKILSHLGYHDNIVNLLGACTRGGPMLMITEYCSHGDLLNFLRSHAQDFVMSYVNMEEEECVSYKNMAAQLHRLRSDSGISCCSEYQDMMPVVSQGQSQQGVQTDTVSIEDLMRFSYQAAQGLEFLSNRNCIHRDVAARNVLLTHHRIAKICDFGLARDIRNDDSYVVQGNARLPVKWMAPESIFQCVYTVQSDVWSYGVLLWEIFSLGRSPYPNVAVDTNFYKMIKDGHHMMSPDFAPAEMYQLMILCWSQEPTNRPTFKTICQLIRTLLPSTSNTQPQHSNNVTYRNVEECREEEEVEEEEEEEGGISGGGEPLKRRAEEERGQKVQ